ncbi:CTP synthase [Bacilliculturomica massiliensis]|uniref:CTP synthase n=1 Tax=Bacilliculturomica massiliensis TaxID=1917867 RepID=UPI001FEB774E|nr:CTP synthase [Bacilliculturomica massiliensis]
MEFMQTILAICGGISIVGGAGAVIYKVIRPAADVNKRVRILEQKADNDYRHLNELGEADRAICRALLALLDHAVTGNGIDNLKRCRTDLQQYLIDK